ncbi:HAD hydrolase-like protein [Candidatus Woesearchaeota archaeon]|nr:HAD hydrolase-like protein [Candidatus Woesearchaeota archaeon]
MKKILAIDFNGALLKHRPFQNAHVKWFDLMSKLLKDPSIKKYAGLNNYFDKVHSVMKQYLGKVDHETRVKFARTIYAMVIIADVSKKDVVTEFANYLKKIKTKYTLALITTAPSDAVEPILEKLGLLSLFKIIYKSPMTKHPDKKQLFKEFIKKYSKPIYYIGNGDKDIESCKKAGIKAISVKWVSKGKFKGDFDVNSVKELKKIIK